MAQHREEPSVNRHRLAAALAAAALFAAPLTGAANAAPPAETSAAVVAKALPNRCVTPTRMVKIRPRMTLGTLRSTYRSRGQFWSGGVIGGQAVFVYRWKQCDTRKTYMYVEFRAYRVTSQMWFLP